MTEGPIFFWEVLGFDIGEVFSVSNMAQLDVLVLGGVEEQHALSWPLSWCSALWSHISSGWCFLGFVLHRCSDLD